MNHFFRPHSANKQRSPAKNAVLGVFFIFLLLYKLLLPPVSSSVGAQASQGLPAASTSVSHTDVR